MPVIVLNVILPLLIAGLLFGVYKVKGVKKKLVMAALIPLTFIVYGLIQPSYLPKGTVNKLATPTFQVVDKPIVDNLRKVTPGEVRDERMKAERQEIHRRLKETE